MKLVLDTNILYSFFWRSSLVKKLLLADHELYAPEFAIEEIEKHKSEILQKTKLTSDEFKEFKEKLQKVIEFVPFSKYADSVPEAFNLMPEHAKDIDFIALAINLGASILSKEKRLKKQSKVKIFDENDIQKLIGML